MIGEFASLAAALAFGLSTVLARRFMVAVAPEAGVLVSITINVVVFVTLTTASAVRGLLPAINPVSIPLFVFGGLAGTLLGRNLSYFSIDRLGPSLATTVRLSNVVFTLLFGLVFLRELPRPWQIAGLAVVTAGLWISLQSGAPAAGESRRARDTTGLLLALAGAAAFGLGDTARRRGLELTPAPVLGAMIGAASAMAAHMVWSIYRRSARWPTGPALRRADLLTSAVFNTIAILLLFTGLRHSPVAIVSVLYNLQVLVVLIISPVLLRGQEAVTAWLVAGAAIALAGTVMILLG